MGQGGAWDWGSIIGPRWCRLLAQRLSCKLSWTACSIAGHARHCDWTGRVTNLQRALQRGGTKEVSSRSQSRRHKCSENWPQTDRLCQPKRLVCNAARLLGHRVVNSEIDRIYDLVYWKDQLIPPLQCNEYIFFNFLTLGLYYRYP